MNLRTDFNSAKQNLSAQMATLDMDNAFASFHLWWPQEEWHWYNTCYNYVLNFSGMCSLLPGNIASRPMPDLTGSFEELAQTVHENVLAEGGRYLQDDLSALEEDETLAALFLKHKDNSPKKKHDLHCYDLRIAEDFSGVNWTHKPGSHPPEKVPDIFECSKENGYEYFLGYYAMSRNTELSL